MKYMNKILAACFCVLLASCMGSDYADPNMTENPFGNSQIAETNVMNIGDLKESKDFKFIIANGAYKKVEKSIQIKGRVTETMLRATSTTPSLSKTPLEPSRFP